MPRPLSILCTSSSFPPSFPPFLLRPLGAGSDEDGIKLITAFRKTTGKNSAFRTPGGRSPWSSLYGRMTSLACCPIPTVHNRVTVAFSTVAQQPREEERQREQDREKERREENGCQQMLRPKGLHTNAQRLQTATLTSPPHSSGQTLPV